MTAAFVAATALPYLLAGWVVRRWNGVSPVPSDRRRFEALLLGTAGLAGLLHALLFAGVLSIPAVAAAGAAVSLACWWRLRAGPGAGAPPADCVDANTNGVLGAWMRRLSTLAIIAVCGVWLAWSASSREVTGTDAAHYHIPHAVNYALGASPWGPMPTRHGYPMGAGVLFAWFILPFGDAFVADASMVIWFLLLVAALASLFHSLTGLDGWTWVPWPVMLLFGLPLIGASASPSADLAYAASFLAVSAQLVWMVGRGVRSYPNWVVLGAALGLLIGTKTPGVYSAAALLFSAGVAHLVVRRRCPGHAGMSWPAAAAIVCGVGFLTGGVWLVRNVWLFGRPVEMYSDHYYLSVLEDVRTVYGGDWLYAAWRARVKIGRVLEPRFLVCGLATAWLVVESAYLALRRRAASLSSVRLWFVGLMAACAVLHTAGLVGAPWTSLEWTDGSSLRYLLPFWVLYAFLAFVGLFSLLIPWHRVAGLRAAGWLLMAAWAVWRGLALAQPGGLNPGDGLWVASAATGLLLAGMAAPAALDRGWPRLRPRAALPAGAVLVLLALAGVASWLTARHAGLFAQAAQEESDAVRGWMTGNPPDTEAHRQVFLEVRKHEISGAKDCRGRRFFVASRFDLPLALQPAAFTSLVFDSREASRVLPLIRRRPPAGVCDYAVVDVDEPSREAIRLSEAWLRPIPSGGRFLVYEFVRPPERNGRAAP
jgi:hypothetical protein